MGDEDKQPVVEISGAAAASLLRTFAECGTGSLLLELELRAVVTRTTENSDLHTAHRTTRERLVLDTWTRVQEGEVAEQPGEPGAVRGFLRFRRQYESLEPSFRDRLLMKTMKEKFRRGVFLLATDQRTECLGLKLAMAGYLVDADSEAGRVAVRIKVPCLSVQSKYMQENPVNTRLMEAMESNVDTGPGLVEAIQSFEVRGENFKHILRTLSQEVLELEEERHALEGRVARLRARAEADMENTDQWRRTEALLSGELEGLVQEVVREMDPDMNMNTTLLFNGNESD